MSTVMNPRGPLPPGVYWVRRLLALLVVVALVLAVRWVWNRAFGSSESSNAAPSTSPTAGPTSGASTPAASPTSAAPTKTPTTSASASPTSTAVPVCPDSAIAVTASTDAASYPVGSTPRLRMRIQNTSSTPCRRDIGAAQNELVITSGSARVWSSDDCNPGGPQQVQTIQPGQSYSVTVTWLGRLSKKGCPADQPEAKAGSYKLTGRNGAITSAPAAFALTAATPSA